MKLFILSLIFLQVVAAKSDEPGTPIGSFCTEVKPNEHPMIVNNTFSVPLHLYWYKHERDSCNGPVTMPSFYYGIVYPGDWIKMSTLNGHVFRLIDESRNILSCLVASFKI